MRLCSQHFVLAAFLVVPLQACHHHGKPGVPPVGSGAPAAVGGISVFDSRESPAMVSFTLTDAEGDPATIQLVYFTAGQAAPTTLTLAGSPSLSNLSADAAGSSHTFMWDFDTDLGSDFKEGIEVRANIVNGLQSILSTATASNVSLGNDSPEIVSVTTVSGPSTGIVPIPLRISDSSDDLVNVTIEYDILGDSPDLGFRLARPAGLSVMSATPAFAFMDEQALRTGVDLSFNWDTLFDTGTNDVQAVLRVSVEDDLLQGVPITTGTMLLDNNAAAAVSNLMVTDTRESPAMVSFRLFDNESDPQRVELFFQRPGLTAFESMTLAVPGSDQNLAADNMGVDHVLLWDFAADLGSSSFVQGFAAVCNVLEGATVTATATNPSFDLGNDPPVVIPALPLPSGEVTGVFNLPIVVSDSSFDLVNIAIEYDIVGDQPDAGFQSARPEGLAAGSPTPVFAFQNTPGDPQGSNLVFAWDVVADQGTTDFSAVLRLRVEDDLLSGPSFVTAPVAFDNNGSAVATIDGASIAANTDGRRGLPIPFTVADGESDPVVFALQWRQASGSFPTLPTTASALRQALSDPDQRRQLQIAAEYRALYEGRLRRLPSIEDPDGDRVGLPDLGSSAAGALSTGLTGDRLEILRNLNLPQPTGNAWTLAGPVAVLRLGAGPSALILDSENIGTWRLREMDLSTGAELAVVASGSEGSPLAMDFRRGATASLLLVVGDGSSWSVLEVDRATGLAVEVLPASSTPVAGAVRAIRSAQTNTAYLTVGDALVRLDLASMPATAVPIMRGFGAPWGLALHPTRTDRLYLADAAASTSASTSGVLEIDLASLVSTHLTQNELLQPRSIAMSPDGTRLVALTDRDSGDGTFELTALTIGGPNGVAVAELMSGIADESSAVELGPDGLTLLSLPSQGDLAVAGGIEQVRSVMAFQIPGAIVTVDEPFDPALTSSLRWRLSEGLNAFATTPAGNSGLFIWDSSDVTSGGQVMLRALALDTDIGTDGAEFALPQSIDSPLDVSPVSSNALSGLPVTDFAASDLDGDGDLDLVSISEDDSFSIAIQEPLGAFITGQTTQVEVGAHAQAIAVADLNNDGLVDLAIGDRDSGIFVFEQDVNGVFGPNPIKLASAGVNALIAGDVNGDGHIDLVAAHTATDSVGVFLGTSGSFSGSADFELTQGLFSPSDVELADLNGDGLVDIAIANRAIAASSSVAIYFQAPVGSGFDTVVDQVLTGPGNSGASSLALVDLNRDGRRDVVVTYEGLDQVGFFIQAADGSFQVDPNRIGDSASIADPVQVIASDVDGDADFDLIVSSRVVPKLAVFLQASDGSYTVQPELSLGLPSDVNGAFGLAALDLDADGRTDIVAARGDELRLDIFYQSRPGDFTSTSQLLSNPALSEQAEFIQPGDFDGDGDLDLAFANRADNHVSMYIQTSPGTFVPSAQGAIGAGDFDGVTALAAGDLDGDGDLDLAGVLTGKSQVGIALQDDAGAFLFDPLTGILGGFPDTFRPRSLAIGDLDGDGDADIVTANTGGDNLSVFLQGPAGVFPKLPSFDLSNGQFTQRPNVVLALDIDGDSDTDLVVANSGNKFDPDKSGITIFLQDGGSFNFAPEISLVNLLPVTEIIDVAAIDIDGDGDLDLVAADQGAQAILIIEQTAPGSFVYTGSPLTIPGESMAPNSIEAADFNGDGLVDVAAVDALTSTVRLFLQFAPGKFRHDPQVSLSALAPGGITVSITAADFDSDGDVDIISADSVGGAHTVHFGGR